MNNEENKFEEKVSIKEGINEVAKMFGNNPEHMVVSDDEILANMKKDLEKRIAHTVNREEKTELEKELLILEILILQREKIDKEASVILSDVDTFGINPENDKIKEKKRKERDKKQQALIDKLNEAGIANLDMEIKKSDKNDFRAKGGMERKERIR